MFHKNRVWCVTPKETAEEVARLLTETTWTLCTAVEIGGYLFLNDATCEDGAQEYAAVKKPVAAGDPYLQVESITIVVVRLREGVGPRAADHRRRVRPQ